MEKPQELNEHFSRPIAIKGPYSEAFSLFAIHDLLEALEFVRDLPYGRNANREEFLLVLHEKQGTCSSKHALIKALAQEQGWDDIELMLCIYRMNAANTPGIGSTLKGSLDYVPEAHCYLKIGNEALDITLPSSNLSTLSPDILTEQPILAHQVNSYKVNFHQQWLRHWIQEEQIPFSFEEVWTLREKCIQALSKK